MIRLVMLCPVAVILGCSVWNGAGGDSSSRYKFAADSWLGAKVEGMIAAWGIPNKGYLPPDNGKEGIAGWWLSSQSGTGHNKTYLFRCETLAYFDLDGTITRIVVEHSRACDRLYEDQLGTMTRLKSGLTTT